MRQPGSISSHCDLKRIETYAVFETDAACGTGSCSAAWFPPSGLSGLSASSCGSSPAGRTDSSPKSTAFEAASLFALFSNAVVEKQSMVDTESHEEQVRLGRRGAFIDFAI